MEGGFFSGDFERYVERALRWSTFLYAGAL
jgi:hypothetical protein